MCQRLLKLTQGFIAGRLESNPGAWSRYTAGLSNLHTSLMIIVKVWDGVKEIRAQVTHMEQSGYRGRGNRSDVRFGKVSINRYIGLQTSIMVVTHTQIIRESSYVHVMVSRSMALAGGNLRKILTELKTRYQSSRSNQRKLNRSVHQRSTCSRTVLLSWYTYPCLHRDFLPYLR